MKFSGYDTDRKVFIVAEAGVNHEGRLEDALELVRQAKLSGADAVKFQTYAPERYIARSETERFERVSRFALGPEQFRALAEEARRVGIFFFSTPLDPASIDALDRYVRIFKISSGDMDFEPLVRRIASKKKPIIISTGTAGFEEIARTLSWVRRQTSAAFVREKVALMHCVAAYPAPAESVNLRTIGQLRERFGLTVGYSDHTQGCEIAPLAVAAGARIIEKHFTLGREGRVFRDHFISADPAEMRQLVGAVRRVETLVGVHDKVLCEAETANIPQMRRGIAAARPIRKGERLRKEDLLFVRPQRDYRYQDAARLVGKKARKDIASGKLIEKTEIGPG